MLEWLYPPKCVVCMEILPINAPRGFCAKCKDALTEAGERVCDICGRPCENNSRCECEGQSVGFVKNRSVFVYDDVMSDIIHAFKYGNHPGHGKIFGKLMGERFHRYFENTDVSLIVPVPMYKPKERKRGYNQADILANEIARHTKTSFDCTSLIRIADTPPQSGLTAEERHKNLSGAFKVLPPASVTGKNVLVVDDIFTTGSTLKECSEELLHAGAAAVYGYTLAVAVYRGKHQ